MSTVTLCERVASTFITKIAYDADAFVLVLQVGQKVYGYANVSPEVADALTSYAHDKAIGRDVLTPGQILNMVIKPCCPLVFSATADQL